MKLVTGVIPLGAKQKDEEGNDTELRLTIASVNGGLDYIQNDEAVQQYGKIFTINLGRCNVARKSFGAKVKNGWQMQSCYLRLITLNAVDLSYANKSISSISFGRKCQGKK